MKILKKGKLPKEEIYLGKCSACGCWFEINRYEGEWEEDRGQDYLTHMCPTPGCIQKCYLKEKN